jgi:hypothetical protein
VTERKPAQAAAIISRIVTAPRKHSTRFGPVQDLTPEEHRRRGGRGCRAVQGTRAPGCVECREVSASGAAFRLLLAHYWRIPCAMPKVRTSGFNLKMTQDEYERLMAYAESLSRTATDILRSYIRRLPDVREPKHNQE